MTSGSHFGVLAALSLALWMIGCADEPEPWPKQLTGRWVTEAPGYEGRYFELGPTMLTIETKVGLTLVQNVDRLEMEESPRGEPVYVVHYFDREGAPLRFQLLKRADDFSRVQLLNRSQVWERVPGKAGA